MCLDIKSPLQPGCFHGDGPASETYGHEEEEEEEERVEQDEGALICECKQ